MGDKTEIEWADATWNPITGCTKVSPGCAYCYIARTPPFRTTGRRFVNGATGVTLHPGRFDQPLRWTKPRRIFVNSLSDLGHEDVPDSVLDRLFAVMALGHWHSFLILTKRPERMREYLASLTMRRLCEAADDLYKRMESWPRSRDDAEEAAHPCEAALPLPNVWLGVTVENQRWADERIPILLDTPAAVRFLSCEPLLGPLDLEDWLTCNDSRCKYDHEQGWEGGEPCRGIDWVIAGGESAGPERRALVERCNGEDRNGHAKDGCGICDLTGWRSKPEALEWVRSIRDQCGDAGVPFHFKQWGGPRPKSGGRLLDGRTWDERP